MTNNQNPSTPEMNKLLHELAIHKLSQPSAEALAKYQTHFEQVQQTGATGIGAGLGAGIGDWLRTLQMQLAWDSRQQPATAGVRSGEQLTRREYRLLYVSDDAEVELMVEPDASNCHIEGDILPSQEPTAADASLTPALISLQSKEPAGRQIETESDPMGRFHFDAVQPGHYTLQLFLNDGTLFKVDSLTLT